VNEHLLGRWLRRCLAWLALGALGMALWGCGSSGATAGGSEPAAKPVTTTATTSEAGGEAVATVGGVAITKATFERWLPVEAVINWRTIALERAPLGVLPDPPSYIECITWLGSGNGVPESRSLSVAQRRAGCQKLLRELVRKTMEYLITDLWYEGEARERHLVVSAADVQSNVARFNKEHMPGVGDFEKYLSATGMSEADATFLERRLAYFEKVRDEIVAQPHLSEVTKALAEFTSRWTARTSCRPGYVAPGCSQYRGPLPSPVRGG
jgi:hypothetical protein